MGTLSDSGSQAGAAICAKPRSGAVSMAARVTSELADLASCPARGHASQTTPDGFVRARVNITLAAVRRWLPRQPRSLGQPSRPPRTARTHNVQDPAVKTRSQPEPTRSKEPDYLRAGIHAE